MNICKKLFGKKEKNEQKEKSKECWYNNVNEDTSSKLGVPMEGVALSDPDQIDFAATKTIAMK
jgi:hypothetical protein